MITELLGRRSLPTNGPALLALLVLAGAPPRLHAQNSCLSNADTAASYIADVTRSLENADSAGLVRVGLPYQPTSVTLVTQEAVCKSAFAAYNALGPSSQSGPIIQAYLIRVESSAYVMVPVAEDYRSHNTFIYLDNKFKVIAHVVDLD